MDIIAKTHTNTYYIDVTIVDPLTETTTEAGETKLRPRRDPLHTAEQEKMTHDRNHPQLVPFAITTRGKLGEWAKSFLRQIAPTDP
eukprot:8019896-Prorocentrum_lima.AAC.1